MYGVFRLLTFANLHKHKIYTNMKFVFTLNRQVQIPVIIACKIAKLFKFLQMHSQHERTIARRETIVSYNSLGDLPDMAWFQLGNRSWPGSEFDDSGANLVHQISHPTKKSYPTSWAPPMITWPFDSYRWMCLQAHKYRACLQPQCNKANWS